MKKIFFITAMLFAVALISCKKGDWKTDSNHSNDSTFNRGDTIVKITTNPATLPVGYISAVIDGIPTSFTIPNTTLYPDWNIIGATLDTSIGLAYLYNELWMDGYAYNADGSQNFIRLDFSDPGILSNTAYPCIFVPGPAITTASFTMILYLHIYGGAGTEYITSTCSNPAPAGGIITHVSIADSTFQGTFSGKLSSADSKNGDLSIHTVTNGAFNVRIMKTKANDDK